MSVGVRAVAQQRVDGAQVRHGGAGGAVQRGLARQARQQQPLAGAAAARHEGKSLLAALHLIPRLPIGAPAPTATATATAELVSTAAANTVPRQRWMPLFVVEPTVGCMVITTVIVAQAPSSLKA
jgi:hypothetical protein